MTSRISGEIFKELNELALIDKRNTFWFISTPETEEQISISLEDWYRQVESIKLCDSVPKIIKRDFNIACNLAIYAWFCSSFHQVCKIRSFSTLELAMKEKFKFNVDLAEKSDLQSFLEKAVNEGFLKGSDILLKELPGIICKFRKDHTQESDTLYKNSWFTLKLCSDLINQVFGK